MAVAAGFVGTIALCLSLPYSLWNSWWIAAVFFLAVSRLIGIVDRGRGPRKEAVLLALFGACAGVILCCWFYSAQCLPALLLEGKADYVSFQVVEATDNAAVIRLTGLAELEGGAGALVRVSGLGVNAEVGMTGVGQLRFYLPQNYSTFDYKTYLATQRIYICGAFVEDTLVVSPDAANVGIIHWLRQTLASGIETGVGTANAPIAKALVIGDRSGIDDAVTNSLNRAGLSHMLAISGMHVMLFAEIVFQGFKKAGVKQKVAAVVVIPCVLLYMALTGFPPSVIRAGIMACIRYFGVLLDRKADTLNSLAVAALVSAGVNPYVALSASFILSYAAVLGIVFVVPRLIRWTKLHLPILFRYRMGRYLTNIFLLSLGINLFLIPFNIYYFRSVSLVAPFSNLIAAPLAPVMIFGSLLTGILGTTIIGNTIGNITDELIGLFVGIGEFFASFSFSSVYLWGNYLIVVAVLILIVILLAYRFKNKAKLLLKVYAPLCCIIFLAGYWVNDLYSKDRLLFVAVNAAYSNSFALIGSEGAVVCLKDSDKYDGSNLNNHLRNQGVSRLEALLVADNQANTISAAASLLAQYEVDLVIAPVGMIVGEIEALLPMENSLIALGETMRIHIAEDALAVSWNNLSVAAGDWSADLPRATLLLPKRSANGGSGEYNADYVVAPALLLTEVPQVLPNQYGEIQLTWTGNRLIYEGEVL